MDTITPTVDPEVQTEEVLKVETPPLPVVLPRPFIFRKLQRPFVADVPNSTDPTGGANSNLETSQDGKPDEGTLEDEDLDDSGSDTSLHADSGVKEDE